ncbi:AMP-binding protein [Paraglaciecola aquimarina]|uniref:AMP-binding protein n=1 Tax=Paraglaciecola aquimarina TaxID=1235557 RepID=A0ABU3T0E4_9ALTE|nr:AMP-binding protein [Paraglaciecola aquimarina]MDU0355715.1 AMP-binding protein [Paraglaciecola aquimarina]
MANLLEQIQKQQKNGTLFYAEQSMSVNDLVEKALKIRQRHPQLRGKKVALTDRHLVDFLVSLIAFDGFCSAMYLCASNVTIPLVDGLQVWPLNGQDVSNSQMLPLVSNTRWYLATSGTTGEPKWFAHTLISLTAETKHSARLQKLCWALMYQACRFAGLQVVLQALLSGADLVDATGGEPLSQLALMQKNKVTAVSATPSLWRQLLMTKQLPDLALSHITLGGEIVDQTLLDQLARLFPQAKVRHIYASTEAGVGFVVSDGKAGFPLSWLHNSELPLALKISSEHHLLVKPNKQAKVPSNITTDELGFMDTQDKVQVVADRVVFLGRATGAINVGGNKVYPEKVEQVLLTIADVSQARVYAKNNPLMGQLVVADIVLFDNSELAKLDIASMRRQVTHMCKNQLQRFEIPTKITVVEHMAHNVNGKLNRQ